MERRKKKKIERWKKERSQIERKEGERKNIIERRKRNLTIFFPL